MNGDFESVNRLYILCKKNVFFHAFQSFHRRRLFHLPL